MTLFTNLANQRRRRSIQSLDKEYEKLRWLECSFHECAHCRVEMELVRKRLKKLKSLLFSRRAMKRRAMAARRRKGMKKIGRSG